MNIVGIIPARGGSKQIPGKNVAPLCGKPLIAWTIEAAANSERLALTVLSTDDEKIAASAKRAGLTDIIMRPAELAADDTPMLPVVRHAVQTLEQDGYRPDIIALLQPTSPLRTARHIDEALQVLIETGADSVVSVVPVPHSCNPYSVMRLEDGVLSPFLDYPEEQNLRQKKPVLYARNGPAVLACTRACLMEKNSLYGTSTTPYHMRLEESVDVDTPFDLELCDWLMRRRAEAKE